MIPRVRTRQLKLSANLIKPVFVGQIIMLLLSARPEMRYLRYSISMDSEPSRLAKGMGIPSAKNPDGVGLEASVAVCFGFSISVLDAMSVGKSQLENDGAIQLFL